MYLLFHFVLLIIFVDANGKQNTFMIYHLSLSSVNNKGCSESFNVVIVEAIDV